LGTRKISHQPSAVSFSTGFFPELLLQKISGGAGILPVQRTGWKPVPPMPLTAYNGWLPFLAYAFPNG
jgi:hypothetical protein